MTNHDSEWQAEMRQILATQTNSTQKRLYKLSYGLKLFEVTKISLLKTIDDLWILSTKVWQTTTPNDNPIWVRTKFSCQVTI